MTALTSTKREIAQWERLLNQRDQSESLYYRSLATLMTQRQPIANVNVIHVGQGLGTTPSVLVRHGAHSVVSIVSTRFEARALASVTVANVHTSDRDKCHIIVCSPDEAKESIARFYSNVQAPPKPSIVLLEAFDPGLLAKNIMSYCRSVLPGIIADDAVFFPAKVAGL